VLIQGNIAPLTAASPDRDGRQLLPPARDAELILAVFDGVCRSAQPVRETNPPFDRATSLLPNLDFSNVSSASGRRIWESGFARTT
jgi:hypothetical protein